MYNLKMKYSATTGGFYNTEIHTPAQIPVDAVDVKDDDYEFLFSDELTGKIIVANADGYPIHSDPLPISDENAKENCKNLATELLKETDWTQLADASDLISNKLEFDSYRSALRILAVNPVVSPQFPVKPTAIWK